jgi:CheY-like chemotaxis protein
MESTRSSDPRSAPEPAGIVLVVDDDHEVRSHTARVLREGGCYVLEARSGPDALSQLSSDAAATALLVTNVVMPEMSGVELADEVHSLWPAVRVLLVSEPTRDEINPSDDDRDELLAKPFDEQQLLRAVRHALRPAA